MKQAGRVVRISITWQVWKEFRLECIRINKPAAYILGELVKRWLKHQKRKQDETNATP